MIKLSSLNKQEVKEDLKAICIFLGFAALIFLLGYQCRKKDYVKIQDNCIQEHKSLIRTCNKALFECKFFGWDGCHKGHRECISPYVKCLE